MEKIKMKIGKCHLYTVLLVAAVVGISTQNPLTAQQPSPLSAYTKGLSWRFVGPVRGGRTEAVVGDPSNPLVFYFGSAHGGVWKTTDAGLYWHNVSDGYFKTAP